jgi:hypothetical protein
MVLENCMYIEKSTQPVFFLVSCTLYNDQVLKLQYGCYLLYAYVTKLAYSESVEGREVRL